MSRRFLAGSLAVLIGLVSLPPAAAQEPTPSGAQEAGDAKALREGFGFASDPATIEQAASDLDAYPVTTWGAPLSVKEGAEVTRRLRVQLSLGPAIDDAESDPQWGGVWVDQTSGGTPVFLFAGPDLQGKAGGIGARLPADTEFRVESVARSMAELRAQKEQVLAERDELLPMGVDVTAVGFDVINNRVAVSVAGEAGAAETVLTSRYGTPITVRGNIRPEPDGCPRTLCLPLKGGIEIVGKTVDWTCTLGYLARRTDTSPDVLVAITAGHCVFGGSSLTIPWRHDTSGTFGFGVQSPHPQRQGSWVHTWFNLADADVGAIGIGNSYRPSNTSRNRILVHQSPPTIRSVTQTLNRNQQAVNTFVCRMGRTTFLQCGFIVDNDETMESETFIGTKLIEHTVIYGRDAVGGDSGGPIFVRVEEPGEAPFVVLYGTHVHSQHDYVPTGGQGWYSAVNDGVNQLHSTHTPFAIVPCITGSCGLP